MPASEPRSRPDEAAKIGGYNLPLTTSSAALLDDGGDRRFRRLIHNLLATADAIARVRIALARRIGVSGPQYGIMIAVAHMRSGAGVSVGAAAAELHVTGAFVTAEAGKLVKHGLLIKAPNPHDKRGVILTLSPRGRMALNACADEIRAINDKFFGRLAREDFDALSRILHLLASDGARTLAYINAHDAGAVRDFPGKSPRLIADLD
ncbi:MAG: MarR family winged helix-turn-helix transcriptional regulator [Candidatus Binataceae bacterium]